MPPEDLKPDFFMTRWLVCGPFPTSDQQSVVAEEETQKQDFGSDFLTEHGGETRIVPVQGMGHHMGQNVYRWRWVQGKDRFSLIDIYGQKNHAVAYAWTEIEVSRSAKTIILGITSDNGVKVWLNGELVHERWAFQPSLIEEALFVARPHPGKNHLLIKVQNVVGYWGFSCRLIGPETAGRCLIAAARDGRGKIASLLLSSGVDASARDSDGRTPLHEAASSGRIEIAKLLLALGAQIDAKSKDGLTPLQLAKRGGYRELANLLIAHGADESAQPPTQSHQVDSIIGIRQDAPGASVIVIQDGRVLHKRGYGLADLDHKTPIRPSTDFYLASVSKQFTAMAIIMLVEQGRLSYDDHLSTFFPEFPAYGGSVTIRDLLHHTSGVPDYFGLISNTADLTNQRILETLIRQKEPEFPPGERHQYSNSGYVLLALIVERVTGEPFHRFLKEHIFEPLGMKRTLVYDESKPAIRDKAHGYTHSEDGYKLDDYRPLGEGDGGIFSTSYMTRDSTQNPKSTRGVLGMSRAEERLWQIGFVVTVLVVAAGLLEVFAAVGRWEERRAGESGRAASIVFCGWGGIEERDVFSRLVAEFRRRNPDVAVEYRPIPRDYMQKLKTMIAGGVPPDVFYIPDAEFPALALRGQMLNLQPYIDRSRVIHEAGFWPSALHRYRFDGRRLGRGPLYALPKDIGPTVMYYNVELFRKAGLPLPDPKRPMTWDEAIPIWRRLTRDLDGDGHIDQWGTRGFLHEAAVWSNGGDYLSSDGRRFTLPDDPRGVEAIQWVADLALKEHVAPPQQAELSMPVDVMFQTGRLATYFLGRWMVPQFRKVPFEWDVAPIPVSPRTRRPASWSGSVGFAIAPHTRFPEAAWRLVEFLAGPEGQKSQSLMGFQIPNQRYLATTAIFLQPGQRPAHAGVFIPAALYERPFPPTQTPDSKWYDTLNQRLAAVWHGEKPAAQLLKEIQPEVQKALDEGWAALPSRPAVAQAGGGHGAGSDLP
jgi:arabinooligosaccharide transport system substrate-binding protein